MASGERRGSVSDEEQDDDDEQHRQVSNEHEKHLSIAAAARETIVGSRVLHLSQSHMESRSNTTSRRLSSAPSQVFHDKKFMKHVKKNQSSVPLEVGHVDVQLPKDIPMNLRGPVEVSIENPEQQATLVPSNIGDPRQVSPDDMHTVYFMAVRAIAGLCPLSSVDALGKACIELVREALKPETTLLEGTLAKLEQPEDIGALMRADLKDRRSRIDARKEQFSTFDAFTAWKKSEKKAIAKLLEDTSLFKNDHDKFTASKRKEQEEALKKRGSTSAKSAPRLERDDEADAGLCSCCFPTKKKPVAKPRPRKRSQVSSRRGSARSSILPISPSNSFKGTSIPKSENVAPEIGFIWLTISLLRYLNLETGVVIGIGPNSIQKQAPNVKWLNENCLLVLDSWCRRYGVSEGQRCLILLEFLVRHPQITTSYFWDAIDLYEPLMDLNKQGAILINERPALLRLSSLSLSWCKACLSQYHDNFQGDVMYKGLGECVQLAIICRHLTEDHERLDSETDARYIDKICEVALTNRYYFVVEAARKMKDDQVAKQAAATPVVAPAKESRQKDSGSGKAVLVPSRQDIHDNDCRIVSSLHLIYVMQLLKKEIDSDMNEFGPILQKAAGFNAAEETSSLYFPLIWNDFKAFLSILTKLIELDRSTIGNAPESLDPYIFQLYTELRSLYDFFAPNVDLPDIHVGEHFAPFVERWLEIQKEQFSSQRVDAALASDKWMALGHTMCTTSVIDLFSLLYPLADAFQHAPYSSAQAISFADLLSECIKYYVLNLSNMLLNDIKISPGNVSEVMALRLNDIEISKVKLSDLLKDINLEKAYGQPPVLSEDPAPDNEAFNAFLGNTIEKSTLDELQCKKTFKHIQEVLEKLSYDIACSMKQLWAALMTELVLHKPLDDPMSLDAVEQFLSPLWENLSDQIEHVLKVVFESSILSRAMLGCVAESMEAHLVPKSKKSTLNEAQLQRIRNALELTGELFKYYGLQSQSVEGVKSFNRVRYLLGLQQGDTSDITTIWSSLPDEKQKMSEQERINSAPYLSREHLRRILLKRRGSGDNDAAAFLKANKKPGWF